jgi:glycerophosphoryl diester phosphodiesterase
MLRPKQRIEEGIFRLLDNIYARWPRKRPDRQRLKTAKIIAHRGIHDNFQVMENTMAAFQSAAAAGIYGVELDLRWTRDGEAVVCHDPDLMRVFGIKAAVHRLSLRELRRCCPQVPRLSEVVAAFGQRLHLMIELKQLAGPPGPYPYPQLAEHLAPLRAEQDYHLMALGPELLAGLDWAPRACLPIARLEVRAFSRVAVERGYAGLCGHYALLRRSCLDRHHRCGQRIGTGFVASRACLYREVNRGVAWLFSNHAEALQRVCRTAY